MSLNFAIIGAGRIARVHSDAIRANGGRLVACFDVDISAAQSLVAPWQGAACASAREAIASPDVEAVIVATPTDTHIPMIEAALGAGKRVLCEKPLAPSLAEAQDALGRIGSNATRVQIGFNRRFDPSHASLRRACADGEVGELEQLVITSRDPAPPTREYVLRSGGLYRDMTIHDLDLARWILNEEFTAVCATGAALVDQSLQEVADVDTATTVLRTASGRQCIIVNSRRAAYGYDQRIEAFGSKGMITSENHSKTLTTRSTAELYRASPRLLEFFTDRYVDSFRLEIASFIEAVESDGEAAVNAIDGFRAMQLAEAATISARQGSWVSP